MELFKIFSCNVKQDVNETFSCSVSISLWNVKWKMLYVVVMSKGATAYSTEATLTLPS